MCTDLLQVICDDCNNCRDLDLCRDSKIAYNEELDRYTLGVRVHIVRVHIGAYLNNYRSNYPCLVFDYHTAVLIHK